MKRKITLLGRITIIKSLAVSMFVHLFISLPAQPNGLISELEKLFYDFLWNSSPDRIKRRIIIKNIACAGLRMVELRSFIKALKVSWLRRILHQTKPNEWTCLTLIYFHTLFSIGGSYAFKLSSELLNPFWKDFMHIWAEICKIVPVENIGQILDSPLWHNKNIGRGKILFKNWHKKGIRVVFDIIGQNGEFYTFEQLKTMYNINGTFLDYQYLLNKIPPSWITQINDNRVFIFENKINVTCNVFVKKLMKAKKGSRVFHDTFVNVIDYIPQNKWQAEIGDITENEWKSYFLSTQKWHEVKLRDFQYKINNNILVTNSFLVKTNKIDSGVCSYYKEQPEKIQHLFLSCPKVKNF